MLAVAFWFCVAMVIVGVPAGLRHVCGGSIERKAPATVGARAGWITYYALVYAADVVMLILAHRALVSA